MKKIFTMIAVVALMASCCGNTSKKAKDAETRAADTTECTGECKAEGECCKEEAACCAGEETTEAAVEETPAAETAE